MNSIQLDSFERDENGKPVVVHGYVAGRPKALTRKKLWDAIEMVLREGGPAQQPANTLPHDYEPVGNGR